MGAGRARLRFRNADVAKRVGLDEIEVRLPCTKRRRGTSEHVSAVNGLLYGVGEVLRIPAKSPGPTGITSAVGLNENDVVVAWAPWCGRAGYDIATVDGLHHGPAIVLVGVAEGPGPKRIAICSSLDEVDVVFACSEGVRAAGQDVSAVSGLLYRTGVVGLPTAIGADPLHNSPSVRLDNEGVIIHVAGDYVPTVRSLADRPGVRPAYAGVG